jgi:hypothetical protein
MHFRSSRGGANDTVESAVTSVLIGVDDADALRALLFPSVLAALVDDHGLRLITLEALPIACLKTESKQEFTVSGKSINFEFQFAPHR